MANYVVHWHDSSCLGTLPIHGTQFPDELIIFSVSFFHFSCTCDTVFFRISEAMSEHTLYDIRGEILVEKS